MNTILDNVKHEYYNNFQHGIKDIQLYAGDFEFQTKNGNTIKCNGEIHFKWTICSGFNVNCILNDYPKVGAEDVFNKFNDVDFISINNRREFGQFKLLFYSQSYDKLTIQGIFIQNKSINDIEGLDSLEFCITNLLLSNYDDGNSLNNNILTLLYKDFLIQIYQVIGFSEIDLRKLGEGQSRVTHMCKITKRNGKDFKGSELKDILDRINLFFSFINGRPINFGFYQCFSKGKNIFNDYSLSEIHSFKLVERWYFKMKSNDFTHIWENLIKISPSELEVLKLATNWYLESNNGLLNSSIMIIQSNLELLCNWIIFEKEKLLVYGDDIEKLTASNKIRLLLNHLSIPLIIPKSIDVSIELIKEIVDGPSLLTNLRNAMVHPKLKNRGKLTSFSESDKNEIKSMSIVYTELAILYMLGYKGQFINRCGYFESKGESMFVPWNRTERIES